MCWVQYIKSLLDKGPVMISSTRVEWVPAARADFWKLVGVVAAIKAKNVGADKKQEEEETLLGWFQNNALKLYISSKITQWESEALK